MSAGGFKEFIDSCFVSTQYVEKLAYFDPKRIRSKL